MRSNLLTLLGISLSLSLQACSTSQVAATNPEQAKPSVIIEPEALAHSLAISSSRSEQPPILLDARKLEDYGPAHLAGAQRLDLRDWTSLSREGDGPNQGLNNAAAWSIRIGALGIDEHTPVIIYDEGGMTSAARAWFILRECGVQNVRVVNGGWSNLCPLLEPSLVQAGNPGDFAPTRFAATTPKHLTTREELKQIATAHSQPVIDVRSADEFTGNVKAQEGHRVGHVPTATNLSHKEMLDERGRLRTPEELRTLFASAGASADQTAVLYCQSGGRAAFAALAAAHAGVENTTVYYMSMGEWLQDLSCPVETPRQP